MEVLPLFQRAIRQGEDGTICLYEDAAIPTLPPGFVLVKTFAVALNPSDYKISKNFPISNSYIGMDFSGTVVQMADDVDSVELGATVIGAAFGFSQVHRLSSGAFAEYVRARADLLLHFSEEALAPIQAATLTTAITTCLLSFWSPDALDLSGTLETPNIHEKPIPVLVYGGSTATGTIAVQLLKLSGYDPIATCSPHNFDMVRSRGASTVFDYSASDVVAQIKEYTGGTLRCVLDCISTQDSVTICYEAIQRPGGRYVSLELIPEELLLKRRAVRQTFVLAGEIFGEAIELGAGYDRPGNSEKHGLAMRHLPSIQRLLDSGRLQTHPVEVLEGGLHGIVQGMEILARGGVSGKKLVAVVGDSVR